MFNYAAKKHGDKEALGTREVFAEENEVQANGTVFKKVITLDYRNQFSCVIKLLILNFL